MYNPTHRFDTSTETVPTSDPTVKWSHGFQEVLNEVAVWDDTVYLGLSESLVAIGRDGNSRWHFNTDGMVSSSPAVVNDTVYFGDGTRVYALDAAAGSKLWDFETDGPVRSSPAVVDGTVFVGSEDDHVYALDAATGDSQWVFETDNPVSSSPAVVDGTVYVGNGVGIRGQLYALSVTTGREQWAFETDLPVSSSPTVDDDTVYVGCNDGNVYALDATTGREQWAFETDDIVMSSPAVVDGTVFVGDCDSHVYALDTAAGSKLWDFKTDDATMSSPAVVDGTVYVGCNDGNVYALDAATGYKLWDFETDGPVRSSPAVVDGTVFVGSEDNHVYAITASAGSQSDGESTRSASTNNAEYTSARISSLFHSAYYNATNLSIFAAIEDPDIVPTLLAESEERARAIASQIDNQEDMEWLVNPKSCDPDTTTPITRPTHKIPESVDLELPNSITYNELEFGDRIGEGGFAEIRAANVRSIPDAQIAVKRLSDEGTVTKEKINRFIKEAELWAQCADHPHVVSVIDWGHVPRPWIAMEHLTGGDLRDRIHDADGGLPLDESLWIATVLAETLADVHHLGVRHLDLQARNIVFAATPEDVWMFPKIGDWGAAKAQRTQEKGPSVLNPRYAAPEQFESDRVLDHRTDIYQLGAAIYELLTGQVPTVNGATGKSIADRSLPVPPSELRSELPASVDEVVQTALDPLPSNRYSRAIYLYDALDEIVED